MANYHKRNSIRAVQWDPENAQSFEDIKKLIAENPGIGWKADNIVRNDASDNIIIRSFGMIVLRIKPYEYLVEGKKDSLCMDVRCVPRKDGPSWCEAAIYYADEDVVTSEPYNSFYNHWVCQTANATYHLYMCVADIE